MFYKVLVMCMRIQRHCLDKQRIWHAKHHGIALTSNVFAQANTACLVSRLLGSTLIPRRNGDIYGKRDITEIHDF